MGLPGEGPLSQLRPPRRSRLSSPSLKRRWRPGWAALWPWTSCPRDRPVYQIQFSIMKDTAVLMLDTTGPGLHKQGLSGAWRHGPLRETLAAAMVLPPTTGAAILSATPLRFRHHCHRGRPHRQNRAPAWTLLFRTEVGLSSPGAWMDAADEAMDREFDGSYDIWGGDRPQGGVHRPFQR